MAPKKWIQPGLARFWEPKKIASTWGGIYFPYEIFQLRPNRNFQLQVVLKYTVIPTTMVVIIIISCSQSYQGHCNWSNRRQSRKHHRLHYSILQLSQWDLYLAMSCSPAHTCPSRSHHWQREEVQLLVGAALLYHCIKTHKNNCLSQVTCNRCQ